MKPNMVFVIIKGSVEQATEEVARRGMNLLQASKSPRWNETLGYIDLDVEYQAEKRVTEWMNEWAKLEDGSTFAPGTLLWFAVAESYTIPPKKGERQ